MRWRGRLVDNFVAQAAAGLRSNHPKKCSASAVIRALPFNAFELFEITLGLVSPDGC